MTITLRPYQEKAINQCVTWFQYEKRGLLEAPTRSGKTVMAAEVAMRLSYRRVVVCTPRIEIAKQWVLLAQQEYAWMWPTTGLLGGGSRTTGHFTACTIASLHKYLDNCDRSTLLIFDEAHRAMSSTGKTIAKHFNRVLFTTASPRRSDKQTLDRLSIAFVVKVGREDLVKQGILIDPQIIHRPCRDVYEIARAVTEEAVGQTVVFCHTKKAAADLARQLGKHAAAITSDTPMKKRAEIMDHYRQGKLRILCNAQVLTEGVDINMTQTVVLADRPRTETAEIQRVGRALGAYEDAFFDKGSALVLVCDPDRDARPIRTKPDKGYVNQLNVLTAGGIIGAVRKKVVGY